MTLQNAIKLAQSGKLSEALAVVQKINTTNLRTFDSLQLHALILASLGKVSDALRYYQTTLKLAQNDVQKSHVLKTIGKLLMSVNDKAQALSFLEKAISHNSTDLETVRLLSLTLRDLNIFDKLNAYTGAVLKHHPNDIEMLEHQLFIATERNDYEGAISLVRKQLDLVEEMSVQQVSSLFNSCIKISIDLAKELVQNKLAGRKDVESIVNVFKAEIALVEKDFEGMLELVSEDCIKELPEHFDVGLAHSQRGKALEKLGDFDAAMSSFKKMNEIGRKRPGADIKDKVLATYANKRLKKSDFSYQPKRIFQFTHVFIVGFPRSGTTLLENILNTQKSIYTLDEKVALPSAFSGFRLLDLLYPEQLDLLDNDGIDRLRRIYYSVLQQYAGDLNQYEVVVDKLPLNLIHLPLINKLFPEAKVIVSIRNPIDACLSCFSQYFQPNAQMNFFTSLEETVHRYVDIFSELDKWETQLSCEMFSYRYEDLIRELTPTVNKIFDFIGYEAKESFVDFNQQASKRIINTPSRDQVKESIYLSSDNKWKSYQSYLTPLLSQLEPFLVKYQYKVNK